MVLTYPSQAPDAAALARTGGTVLLEFGVDWCPHCQAAEPAILDALATRPAIRHLRIEDGRGRPLGRAYGVKLWPTLVFLRDGQEFARVVRPADSAPLRDALGKTG